MKVLMRVGGLTGNSLSKIKDSCNCKGQSFTKNVPFITALQPSQKIPEKNVMTTENQFGNSPSLILITVI